MSAMHKIGFIVYPRFQLVCLAASSVFEVADRVLDAPHYEVSIRSEAGGTIRGTAAVSVLSEPLGDESFDSLIVCGGDALPEASADLVEYLRDGCEYVANRGHLHGCVHARASGASGRSQGHDALDDGRRTGAPLSRRSGRSGPDLRSGRSDLDICRDERGNRYGAGHGGI